VFFFFYSLQLYFPEPEFQGKGLTKPRSEAVQLARDRGCATLDDPMLFLRVHMSRLWQLNQEHKSTIFNAQQPARDSIPTIPNSANVASPTDSDLRMSPKPERSLVPILSDSMRSEKPFRCCTLEPPPPCFLYILSR